MQTKIKRPYQSGFTLLEVLFGMLVMTLGLLGLAMMQGASMQGNSFADRYSQASLLAQMKIEDLISEPFYLTGEAQGAVPSQLVAGSDEVETNLDIYESSDNGRFTRNWTVSDIPGSDFSRAVEVTVTWQDAGGRDRRVSYATQTRGWGN